jgi:iron only hydrogenase large subunit-like protein
VAVVTTRQNFEKLLPDLKNYHYIEIMNCVGGCLGGGGMPLLPIKPADQAIEYERRRAALFGIDTQKKKRIAHSNLVVAEYMKWVADKNDKHFAHEVYHNDWS